MSPFPSSRRASMQCIPFGAFISTVDGVAIVLWDSRSQKGGSVGLLVSEASMDGIVSNIGYSQSPQSFWWAKLVLQFELLKIQIPIAESGERIDELSAYPFKEFILQRFPNCYIMAIEDICRVVEEFDD